MRLSLATLAFALFAGLTHAQTTGVPGWNDFLLNGDISGSTSCNSLTFVTPLALTLEEMGSGDFISSDLLRPVLTDEPYGSPDEYMDVYFRLMRAEAFHAIHEA